jgi:mRNA interferase RelE/StbE
MPRLEFPDGFQELVRNLPPDIRKKLGKTLQLLADNPRHPSLQSKKVEGAPGIYEARVDLSYRLTYERLPGDVLRLRVIGKHDETLRNP